MQQLTQGTLLHGGTYKIEKVLGQGSFGITYLAEHTNLGKKVAIKEFFMKELNSRGDDGSITGMSDGSLSQNYCQKFQKEAINLSRLDHPNIVRVTDSFSENGTFYYVMDYIEGQNLNDYVKSHYVDAEDAVSIIKSVADALIYMHEKKHMLHLDLKPSNVMRRNDGHVFLIDFGLSKHYGDDGQPETSTTIGLGTAGYAPIEQANRAKTGEFRPTIDVYALGATLYKLLTRETPPDASGLVSDEELLANKLREKKVSDNLIKVVTEAMCPNVKKRIQSVREFVDVLTGSVAHTINSISTKSSEEETVVVKNETKTTDGEETVVANKNTDNCKISKKNEKDEDSCVGKEQVKESSNREAKFIISFFVLAVVFTFIFLGFRGCEVNRVAPPAANADSVVYADSDTVMVVDTTADGDDFYLEKSNNQNYLNTIDYSSSKVTDIGSCDGRTWKLVENRDDVNLVSEVYNYSLVNINWQGGEEHRLSSVLAVKLYKGKIWFIAYDDSHSIGATGVLSGIQILYYDVWQDAFHFVMNCNSARFKGKTIEYCEAKIEQYGSCAAENEYSYNWYYFDL